MQPRTFTLPLSPILSFYRARLNGIRRKLKLDASTKYILIMCQAECADLFTVGHAGGGEENIK